MSSDGPGEIVNWLGSEWDDDELADLVELIRDTGSQSQALWALIVAEYEGDEHPAGSLRHLQGLREDLRQAEQALFEARQAMYAGVQAALERGVSKREVHRATGLARPTIDRHLSPEATATPSGRGGDPQA